MGKATSAQENPTNDSNIFRDRTMGRGTNIVNDILTVNKVMHFMVRSGALREKRRKERRGL